MIRSKFSVFAHFDYCLLFYKSNVIKKVVWIWKQTLSIIGDFNVKFFLKIVVIRVLLDFVLLKIFAIYSQIKECNYSLKLNKIHVYFNSRYLNLHSY